MRSTITVVARRLAHARPAQLDVLGGDAVPAPIASTEPETPAEAVFRPTISPTIIGVSCRRLKPCATSRPQGSSPALQALRYKPARVSATTCWTTALRSPVSRKTRSCRSALVPSARIRAGARSRPGSPTCRHVVDKLDELEREVVHGHFLALAEVDELPSRPSGQRATCSLDERTPVEPKPMFFS